ncbi:MAG TPA: T9SS type A sorting domain-containing protein [Flavobacteriaceae bacterium]|nr:T9SS type A sorting domain-containing protein [Flavobacteriaceae bacterium]
MYKFYNFCLLFAFALQTNAQTITLTSSNNIPNVGDSFGYYYISDYAFDVSQTGANQTWDFSSVSGTLVTINFIDPSASMDAASFPQATLVSTQTIGGINVENYYSSSSSDFSFEGNYAPSYWRTIYSDKQEYLKFPITYNDVFNETYSGTYNFILTGTTYDRVGTIEISADGYGDLVLPYTTVHNVLKVKITSDYTDTDTNTSAMTTSTEVTNVWYDTSNRLYLASTTEDYSGGTLQSSTAMYISESDLALGVDDSPLKDRQITIYPNPADNYFNIKNPLNESLNANIYDISGRNVKTMTVSHGNTQINTSNLHSGMYFIKYVLGSQYYTKKLVVK